MAVQPLSPATHHRLGRPLPYQLANAPQAPHKVDRSFKHLNMCFVMSYPVLSVVSNGYPRPYGRLPTCYSPVRHGFAEGPPYDLHVLGMPPALILSQDQTLQKIYFCLFISFCSFFKFKELFVCYLIILTLSSSYIVFKDSIALFKLLTFSSHLLYCAPLFYHLEYSLSTTIFTFFKNFFNFL